MEVAILEEQKMGKDEIRVEQPLDEESEIGVVEVDYVPWREGRRNDRDENGGSCEKLKWRIEQGHRIQEKLVKEVQH